MPGVERSAGTKRSAGPRLHGLDTLRAVAILAVMPFHLARHFPEALQPAAAFGWMGVDLFFVLSGYLIGMQVFRPYPGGGSLDVGDFYRRRAYRILPAFFAVLLLYVLVPVWREAPGMQPAWQFATFTENLLIDYSHNHAFSHAWSICVEEHFYMVLPVLTIALMRRPRAWKVYGVLASLALGGMALRAYLLVHVLRPLGPESEMFSVRYFEDLYYRTPVRLDGLLAGVALALAGTFRPGWAAAMARRGHSLAAAGVVLVGVAGWCSVPRLEEVTGRAAVFDVAGYPLLGVGFALLTASAVSENGWLARVRVPGAKLLATLAFSLYLTHKEAVHILLRVFPGLPDESYWTLPLTFAACLGVAGLLYVSVERPFLRLRDRGRRQVAGVSGSEGVGFGAPMAGVAGVDSRV